MNKTLNTDIFDEKTFEHPGAEHPTPQTPKVGDRDDIEETTVLAIPKTASDKSAASQVIDAVAKDRQCTLTIGEAQSMFVKYLRRPLSPRSLQRYCSGGAILAQIVTHSHGKEWLINEPSLIKFIETYPITLAEPAPAPDSPPSTTQTTRSIDKPAKDPDMSPDLSPVAPPRSPKQPAKLDTDDDFVDPRETGEKRRVGELLIETARLSALLEGKDEVIETLKSHDTQMREQLSSSQSLISKLTGDVTRIASQMLHTMQAIGTAGKALPSNRSDDDFDKPTPTP